MVNRKSKCFCASPGLVIAPEIACSTYAVTEKDGIHYRLHENAQVMWFMLLPETEETEFFRLSAALQQSVLEASNEVSQFLERYYTCDKINIASIGNVVSQMHFHIIGRRFDDAYWPEVVWGKPYEKIWTQHQVADICEQFHQIIT